MADGETVTAQVVDVSSTGIRLRADRALVPGTNLSFKLNQLAITANVRYCRSTSESEYDAGLYIETAETEG
jgi:hypothetical protein